jgi:hypothetical protein
MWCQVSFEVWRQQTLAAPIYSRNAGAMSTQLPARVPASHRPLAAQLLLREFAFCTAAVLRMIIKHKLSY